MPFSDFSACTLGGKLVLL